MRISRDVIAYSHMDGEEWGLSLLVLIGHWYWRVKLIVGPFHFGVQGER